MNANALACQSSFSYVQMHDRNSGRNAHLELLGFRRDITPQQHGPQYYSSTGSPNPSTTHATMGLSQSKLKFLVRMDSERRNYAIGIFLLLIVVCEWTGSSFLTQVILPRSNPPDFVTPNHGSPYRASLMRDTKSHSCESSVRSMSSSAVITPVALS